MKNKKSKEDITKIDVNEEALKGIEKEIVHKTKLSNEENLKINKKLFENILIANIIMVFLYFVCLGALNIDSDIFLTDLRVFSVSLIIVTIILFERSYKKDSFNLLVHGLECFAFAIFMLYSISIYSLYIQDFDFIVAMASLAIAIYYVGKSIIIYIKMRKKYLESVNDISDIIKK